MQYIVICYSDSGCAFELDTGFSDHLRIITSKYNNLTELHTPNITVSTAQTLSSLALLGVSW
jgi:hypothetical protein